MTTPEYQKEYRKRNAEKIKAKERERYQAKTGKEPVAKTAPVEAPNEPEAVKTPSKPFYPPIPLNPIWDHSIGCTGCNAKPSTKVDENEYGGTIHPVYLCANHLEKHRTYLAHGSAPLLAAIEARKG